MNILIVDNKSSENYDFNYMQSHSLGGTESTVLRVARELAREHAVSISQINRTEPYSEEGINYIHRSEGLAQTECIPDIIIILRKYRLVTDYRALYPDAKLFVWVHNFQRYDVLGRRHRILKAKAQVICVSQCHQEHINKVLNGGLSWLFRFLTFEFKNIPLTYIYNIIDEGFTKINDDYDKNKLFFFSSANKGLKEVMGHFSALLKKSPNYHLYIAGSTEEEIKQYPLDQSLLYSDSVTILGKIPKNEIIAHLRDSFCVFYPQHVHPETFGLIYIEANCVGTPVLAHSFGATDEVIGNREQLVDATNPDAVVDKMLDWQKNGRPQVTCQEKFQLATVLMKWKQILGLD
jgi:glycosyltransferase involved in cell wall biosynthesis